ncbi:Os08g0246000, partial [Oryza sativa Japonica Group]
VWRYLVWRVVCRVAVEVKRFMSEDHFATTTMNDCIKDEMYCTEDGVALTQVEMVNDNEQTGYA